MLTLCPNCTTHFRVTPAQLKVRAGDVRCGQCNHVFNALDTLVENPAIVPADAETVVAEQAAESNEPLVAEAAIEGVIEEAITAPDQIVARESSDSGAEVGQISEPAVTAEIGNHLADPLLHESAPRTRRWPWAVASVFALFALLLQAIYYYRVEVAVLRPDLRPILQTACKSLHCEVSRPRHIETLGIDASDLHPEPLQAGRLTLTATLRSKAPYAQEWPMLELTLTDVTDSKLAVKDFAASDYLLPAKNKKIMLAGGFPAKGEIAVNLPLDVGDLPAAGYRLYIFYP